MADVRPFRALRPRNDLAADVIAPPYDVLSEEEARAIAANPYSFVHVTRPEVDLAPGTDPHGDDAYAKARENLDAFRRQGTLLLDSEARFTFYGQRMGQHRQVGILAACSVAEYADGRIRKHELTRPDKEDDRTRHMEALDAQVGLVFLAYRASKALKRLTANIIDVRPDWFATTDDGVVHELWSAPAHFNDAIRGAFAEIPQLYVADGHHRSAAASRVHARRGDDASAWFLAGLFPDDELTVMAYNRLVHDLRGFDAASFLKAVRASYEIVPDAPATPKVPGEVSMYLDGRWYGLTPRPGVVPADPVGRLDVSVLQDRLLGPVLGIDDPRRSERISFVGGIRGTKALSDAVDTGRAAVAFSLHPTSLEDLFAVADAGQIMPPKSTWFEPKLREGVVVRLLEG